MDFSTIPKAGEGARNHEKERKEERKEHKGLPQASAASSAPFSGEHGKRLPWLLQGKEEESGSKITGGGS